MRQVISLVCLAACLAAEPAPAATQEPAPGIVMGPAREFPHAGVSLSVPNDFAPVPAEGLLDVMRAVRTADGKPVQAITLSAFCVDEKMTADAFADAVLEDLKQNLSFRHVQELKKTPMRVAGVTGTGRLVSYELRGLETTAARVYFIRTLKPAGVPVCYVLTVEAVAAEKANLLPILGEMIKTVVLTPPRHPAELPVDKLGPPVRDARGVFSIRAPEGWHTARLPAGIEMGQIDYLRGGSAVPLVNVVMAPSRPGETAETCASKTLQVAVQRAADLGQTAKVLSEGPARLGALEAREFVLQQTPRRDVPDRTPAAPTTAPAAEGPPPAKPAPVLIVQRTACAAAPAPATQTAPATQPAGSTQPATTPAAEPAGRTFYLILVVQGIDAKAAQAMMETLAGGFELLPAPATAPATAPTTAPATAPVHPAAPAGN